MKLNELYKAMLATIMMTADKEGFVSVRRPKTTNPAVIDNKRVVLPTPEQLANPKWDDRIAFHPLYESVGRGESEVARFYRSHANSQLGSLAALVCLQLLQVATSPACHPRLDKDQSEFLDAMKDADGDTVAKWAEILGKVESVNSIVNIYIKRGGMYQGRKHARVAVVTFPLYEELQKADKEIFGVKLRTKKQRDRETLMALIEYIFPRVKEPDAYNYGSDSSIAPTMDALMHAMNNVIGPINDVISMFNNVFEEKLEELPTDWLESFDSLINLKPEIYSIPQLMGNEGTIAKGDLPQHAPPPQQAAVAPQQPMYPQQPVPTAPQQQVAYPTAYPMQQPVQQTPAPSGPMDFDTMVRNNPLLASGGGRMNPAMIAPVGMAMMQPQLPPGVRPVAQPQMMMGYPQQGMVQQVVYQQPQQPMYGYAQPTGASF